MLVSEVSESKFDKCDEYLKNIKKDDSHLKDDYGIEFYDFYKNYYLLTFSLPLYPQDFRRM